MTMPRAAEILDDIEYPTSDGKPMAETDMHRDGMVDLIAILRDWYSADPTAYVSGNMLMYYVEGDRHKHVAPDVFVVLGIPKQKRECYLLWKEGRSPDLVIELTSKSTRKEDQRDKLELYRDVLKVREYFQFDPLAEYLRPPLQGRRLRDGMYEPIAPVAGRLPSEVLGLHFERRGEELRLFNPQTGEWLPTPQERAEREAAARRKAEAENERLRDELDELRRRLGGNG